MNFAIANEKVAKTVSKTASLQRALNISPLFECFIVDASHRFACSQFLTVSQLTFPVPCISESCIEIKIK